MRNTLFIAGKELRSYFVSPVAYVIVAFWLVATGFFFWRSVDVTNEASLRDVFSVVTILLLLISPALTMRLLAEELRTGTLELLLTAPVRDWSVVIGKFLGALGLYAVMIGPHVVLPGPVDAARRQPRLGTHLERLYRTAVAGDVLPGSWPFRLLAHL